MCFTAQASSSAVRGSGGASKSSPETGGRRGRIPGHRCFHPIRCMARIRHFPPGLPSWFFHRTSFPAHRRWRAIRNWTIRAMASTAAQRIKKHQVPAVSRLARTLHQTANACRLLHPERHGLRQIFRCGRSDRSSSGPEQADSSAAALQDDFAQAARKAVKNTRRRSGSRDPHGRGGLPSER